MTEEEKAYFEYRAEVELKQASTSECPEAVRVHYILANHYLDRAHGPAEASNEVTHVRRA